MPEIENTIGNYLSADRSVNVRKSLEEQEAKKKQGLENIQVRSTPHQLGKDDFLKLLVTQLSYQDPTSPMKDQQFIAQMAQFSSLEQMQNMASSLGRLADRQAHEMIGRYVVGPDFINGQKVEGLVEALFYDKEGKSFLKVKGRAISLDTVQVIADPKLIALQKTQSSTLEKNLNEKKLNSSNEVKLDEKNNIKNKNKIKQAIKGYEQNQSTSHE